MKTILTIALTILTSVGSAYAEPKTWDSLRAIAKGHKIRVHTAGQKQTGNFVAVDDSRLRFTTGAGSEVTVPRDDITKVYSQSSSHRIRNILIGTAIGIAAGAVTYGTLGQLYHNEGHDAAATFFVPIAVGSAVGAALPTGTMKLIYDARKPGRTQP